MENTVLILGVGRSGTTAIYRQLQDIYFSEFAAGLRSVYEPFLWSWKLFDGMYSDVDRLFDNMSSVSYEAIVHSKTIPLFVLPDQVQKYAGMPFIADISRCPEEKSALLSKMIRANGRYHLLKQVSPQAKFIYILRNPLDVINSSSEMFSFFGEDFHESDYERFMEEVSNIYGDEARKLPSALYSERQACYWYFMNRFFLESSAQDPNVLKILYSDYVKQPEIVHENICNFLGIDINKYPFSTKYKNKAGPSFSDINLSAQDVSGVQVYVEKYAELLQRFFPGNQENISKILEKYAHIKRQTPEVDKYLGKTPLLIKGELMRLERAQLVNNSHQYRILKKWRKSLKKLLKKLS